MKYPLDKIELYYWWVDNQNKAQQRLINLSYASPQGRNGFSLDQKVCLIDPSKENPEMPMFARIRGFYTDEIFLSDGFILPIELYQKIAEHDRTFLRSSKYPNTEDLRDYCNWLFLSKINRDEKDIKNIAHYAMMMKEQYGIDGDSIAEIESLKLLKNFNIHIRSKQRGLEFIPRHLHYDDFIDTWGGNIEISLSSRTQSHNDYRQLAYRGITISSNFKPANSHQFLNEIEWFDNIEHYGYDRGYEELKKSIFYRMFYDPNSVEIYAELKRNNLERRQELEMWDPIKDIVRVEKILGNVSFLSEFGYICTMSKYQLIIGDLISKQKYILIE